MRDTLVLIAAAIVTLFFAWSLLTQGDIVGVIMVMLSLAYLIGASFTVRSWLRDQQRIKEEVDKYDGKMVYPGDENKPWKSQIIEFKQPRNDLDEL